MGGCVASVMERRNDSNLQISQQFTDRLNFGAINVKVTEDGPDQSGIYRSSVPTAEEHEDYFNNWYKDVNIMQVVEQHSRNQPDKRAIAYRTIEKTTTEATVDSKGNKRNWEFVHLTEPSYLTYSAFWEMLTSFGRGLASLGLGVGDRMALYEETRHEWLASMLGLWTQGMVGVTVYANLGYDALIYALKEAACKAMICNGSNVGRLVSMMSAQSVDEAIVIYMDELPGDVDLQGVRVVPWGDVLEAGRRAGDSVPAPAVPTDPDTEVLVMYTSGTTGNPKGVVHSIGGLTQGAHGLSAQLIELLGKEENETYVAYLPAAHIFEFICEMIILMRGILLCFGSPRTLTDAFARPCGDITLFNPFFLIGVPRVFETIKKTVESKLPPVGSIRRTIFDRAYESRRAALLRGMDTPYWNEKVFKPTRALMGGRMRGICSGGAPLADKTQEWISVVLGVPVAQGYGMTETVCNAAVQRTGELKCEAGQFLKGVEAMLLDTEDHKHTDLPHPRGELCLRGNFMFKGYYKQPQLTKEVMMKDGWLRTGDIAEISSDNGQVRIAGRVKALAKNVYGEYISMEALEALYCLHPLVIPNGICILVHPEKSYIAALVLTIESKAMSFAAENNISGSWPAILENATFQEAVAQSFTALAKREGRQPFECIRKVRVLNEEWTPENNLVTASLKVRRSVISKHYADIIAELFSGD